MALHFNKAPEITEYVIETDKLNDDERYCFACFSDLHESVFGRDNDIFLSVIREIRPDGILIPGDFVDASPKGDPRDAMVLLKKIREEFPLVCYSPGNHERKIFERIKYTKQMVFLRRGLKDSGVSLMRNEFREFGKNIRIYALDLNHDYYRRIIKKSVPDGMMNWLLGPSEKNCFNILLAHDPDHFPEYVKWKPDLILSGHIHGGLVRVPGIGGLISPAYRFFPKYDNGIYEKDNVRMIVSRGAGSHTVNIRINNAPEVLKIVLKGRKNGA